MLKVGDKVLWRYGKSKNIKDAGKIVSVESWPLIKVLFPGNVTSTIPQDDLIKVEGSDPVVECIREEALRRVPAKTCQAYGPLEIEFSQFEAKRIGDTIGVDWRKTNLEQFRMGLAVELEHGCRYPETNITCDDLYLTGKIALIHLKEVSDYYTKLKKVEA